MAVSINKNWLLLAGAIALGGLAFFLSNKAINTRMTQIEEEARKGRTMVKVVVPNRPLKAGEIIDSSVVSVREIPSEFVNKSAIEPDAFKSVDGQALQVDIDRGEPILTNYTASRGGDIFAAVLQNGRRALTIEVDEISSFSGMLRPGDRIDLMLTAPPIAGAGGVPSGAKELTFPMLSNLEVLATGQAQKAKPAAGELASRGFSHVTLDVTPREATLIIAAKQGGKLTAVLRGPSDKVPNPSGALTIDDATAALFLKTKDTQSDARRIVQFIIGGSGGAKVSDTPVLDNVLKDPKNRVLAERMAANLANEGSPKPAVPAPPAATGTAGSKVAPIPGPVVPLPIK